MGDPENLYRVVIHRRDDHRIPHSTGRNLYVETLRKHHKQEL
jgi:hypothetical protein